MNMLMMFVMGVFMTMFHRFVYVGMYMPLGQVQPDTNPHEYPGYGQPERQWLSGSQRENGAKEGSHGKIGSSARRSKMPHADDKKTRLTP